MNPAAVDTGRLIKMLEEIKDSGFRLIAPAREDNMAVFKQISDVNDIVFDDEITYKSPKEYLFPQIEKILEFSGNTAQTPPDDVRTVIFGVRPCDLAALKVMTAIFSEGRFKDPFFLRHLENTITIGLACSAMKPGCFCGERGVDKDSNSDCDIFISHVNGDYGICAISEKGRQLLGGLRSSNAADGMDSIRAGSSAEVQQQSEGLLEIDADENTLFNKPDWGRLSEKCLGCGICTYICPTCHCFEFRDVAADSAIPGTCPDACSGAFSDSCSESGASVRYRYWDSCMYPKFTLHTSGHNPRPSKKERYRQRIMHKYHYIRRNFGHTACTGCGRCIRSCPAGMNIRTVVKKIAEDLK